MTDTFQHGRGKNINLLSVNDCGQSRLSAISSSAASPQRGSCRKTAQGKCSFLWMIGAKDFCGNHQLPARGFRQNAITIFRWCIIAPYSKIGFLAPVQLLRSLSIINQHIQLLLNRFVMKHENQKFHYIIIGQNCWLYQKGFQHSGTGAKAVGSFASGQSLDFAFQLLFLVLGCGQFFLSNIFFMLQLFQFFIFYWYQLLSQYRIK